MTVGGREPDGDEEPPALVEPGPVDVPTQAVDIPTQAIELDATQAIPLDTGTQPVGVVDTGPFATRSVPVGPVSLVSSTGANELLTEPPATPVPAEQTSAIETLFADSRFRHYDEQPPAPAAAPAPRSRPAERSGDGDRHQPPHMTRTQRVLLSVAGGLVGLLGLCALFFLGTRLPITTASAPVASHSAAPRSTPTPVPTVLPPGPVAAGSHRWDQLLGGECLGSYPGPWAERYTVVDCAAPHPAQMVFRGRFPDPATPGYPGAAALQSQMSILCSQPGVIDLNAASQYTDAQIEASYPVTAKQWDAGDHWYYCFVSRSSKEPLTGSVAVAAAAPGS